MFIDMILKTIPRSWRAAAALLVALACVQQVFTRLQSLLLSQGNAGLNGFVFIVALVLGVASTTAFYYFQSVDDRNVEVGSLETLDKYHRAQAQKERIERPATAVFSSHQGEIPPGQLPRKPTSQGSQEIHN